MPIPASATGALNREAPTWPSCRGPGGKFAACGGSCAPELRRHGDARRGIGAYATMQAEELHAVASLCPGWSCSCRLSLPIPGHQPCAQREESSTRNAANILPVAQDAAGHSCRSRSGNPALFVPRARRDMLACCHIAALRQPRLGFAVVLLGPFCILLHCVILLLLHLGLASGRVRTGRNSEREREQMMRPQLLSLPPGLRCQSLFHASPGVSAPLQEKLF